MPTYPNRGSSRASVNAHRHRVDASIQNHVLGNSVDEQNRLRMQAGFLEKWTEEFLVSAGLTPGMRVLDVGCGMGDVSMLAARLVGETGSVTGLDRDGVVLSRARERVSHEMRLARVEFIESDLFDFRARHEFDAVIGRYFLLYQPDAVAAISQAARQVRSGGIIVFHELDFANLMRSYPDGTLFARMQMLLAETFRRAGFFPDLGLHLTRFYLDAGLPWPVIQAQVPVGGRPGSFIYRWMTETLRSLLPRIEQFGLATAAELDLDTLVSRMDAEGVARQSQLLGPIQFGAWTNKG